MPEKIKVDIEKPVQEFEIGGKVYKLLYDDDSLKRYQKEFKEVAERWKEYENIDFDKLSEKEAQKYHDEQEQILKDITENLFGEGSFEQIYEACHRSTFNLLRVVEQVRDWYEDMHLDAKQRAKKYYTEK